MKYLLLFCLLLRLPLFGLSAKPNSDTIPPGWWKVPGKSGWIHFGGYVKADLIHDFNPINSPSYFDVSKIPTNGSKGNNTHLQANETRLYTEYKLHHDKGELRAYVEGDFYGTSSAFRLRHAFVEINGRWLAGQTWSNFMDPSIIPNTLDFEKPTAYALVRHGIFQYKMPTGKKSTLAFALEEPLISAEPPARPGKLENAFPDLTANYRIVHTKGHFQLSGFAGIIRFRPQTGSPEDSYNYGINLSASQNIGLSDAITFQLIAGQGISKYRGGIYAAPDSSDHLQPIPGLGVTLTYCHHWTKQLSSLLVGNYGYEDNLSTQAPSDIHQVFYGALNLIWNFHPSAYVGVEYLHGGRMDKDMHEGRANRLQFSFRVNIN